MTGTVSVVAGLAFWLGPKLYLRFSGREPEANASSAAASRPGHSSGFPPKLLEVGVRLASLSESERREGLQSVELVLDVAESGRQPVKLRGLNPAGRALVHQLCSSRGLNHETSEDKEYMSVWRSSWMPPAQQASDQATPKLPLSPARSALELQLAVS